MRQYAIPFLATAIAAFPAQAYAPREPSHSPEQLFASRSIPVYTGVVLRKETIPTLRCYRMEKPEGRQLSIPQWYDESKLSITLLINKREQLVTVDPAIYSVTLPGELITVAESNYRVYKRMKSPRIKSTDITKLFAASMAEGKELWERFSGKENQDSLAKALTSPFNQVDLSGRPLIDVPCSYDGK